MKTVLPVGMSVIDWTDSMNLILVQYGSVPRLDNPDDWREWGRALLDNVSLGDTLLPDPYQFAEWRPWADRVVEILDATVV